MYFGFTFRKFWRRVFGEINQESVVNSIEVQTFARACLDISWKMVLQSPPMTYEFPERGTKYDARQHELNFGSKSHDVPNVAVDCVVFPALKHGEKRMSKAKVMLDDVTAEHRPSPEDKEVEVPPLANKTFSETSI